MCHPDLTRFVVKADHLEDLVRLGTLTKQAATFLAVASSLNVLVAGGTQAAANRCFAARCNLLLEVRLKYWTTFNEAGTHRICTSSARRVGNI